MSKSKKTKSNQNFLPGLEDFGSSVLGDLENDPSLEAELLELIGGGGNSSRKTDRNKKKDFKPIAIDSNLLNLDLNDDVNDADLDENDPDLLAELDSFMKEDPIEEVVQKNVSVSSPSDSVNKLENLKKLYQEAIKQVSNDSSKSRRYQRSLNQINELLQKCLRGQPVDESEFPPQVHINSNMPVSALSLSPKIEIPKDNNSQLPLHDMSTLEPPNKSPRIQPPQRETVSLQSSQNPLSVNKVLNALIQRQVEYKHAALEAKSKDISLAKGLMIAVKRFDEVIQSVKNGEYFDLETMPPPPSEFKLSDLDEPEEPTLVVMEPEKPIISSLGEELKLRQAFYKDSLTKSKLETNESKVRRLGRLVQQYDEALEAFRKNQPYQYEDLPPPPGRPPLSSQNLGIVSKQLPAPSVTSSKPKQVTVSKNTKTLLDRQAQFKSAALKAKLDGDLPLAKELLKQSKGFDQMIQASEAGFPVNLSSLPSLPTEPDYNYELINVDECEIPKEMLIVDKDTLFKQLQMTLMEQIKICSKYEMNVTKAGDIISAKRFESLAKNCEKDLSGLKCLIQKNADIPKFHYEYKIFSVLQSNPDLGETEMFVDVIKGINFAVPAGYTAEQLDTYIILELPFPNDAFQTFTSETIKRTNNPVYNSHFKFQVNLKSRVFQRVAKSKQLKADIYYKKGFLQKDKLLGTSQIKLEKLDTQCTIHEAFDIFENRKLIGGKLEVKIRTRMPLSGNQSENIKEKWLVIDDFNQKNVDLSTGSKQPMSKDPVLLSGSIDVFKYEIGNLKRKLATGGQMTPAQINLINQKIHEKELVIKKQEEKLKSSDPSMRLAYLQSISKLPQEFNNEAKKFLSTNNRDKAQISITKKKLVEKEIEQLKDSRYKN